jgi:biopolymer transport protein ExbD
MISPAQNPHSGKTEPVSEGMALRRSARRRRAAARRRSIMANLAPMIDMSFILVIFFVVTTTFDRPEGLLASKLPKESGEAAGVPLPLSPIVIRILEGTEAGTEYVIRVDRFQDPPQNFAGLGDFLHSILGQPGFDDQTPVVILAEDAVEWDHVVNAWNAAARAGFKNLVFGQPNS